MQQRRELEELEEETRMAWPDTMEAMEIYGKLIWIQTYLEKITHKKKHPKLPNDGLYWGGGFTHLSWELPYFIVLRMKNPMWTLYIYDICIYKLYMYK